MKTECSMSYGRLDNVCEMWLFVFGCFVLLRNKISLTQLLPFELFSKKFCLNISELGLEIV